MKRPSKFVAFPTPCHFRSVSMPCAPFPLISAEISHGKDRDLNLNATAVLGSCGQANWNVTYAYVALLMLSLVWFPGSLLSCSLFNDAYTAWLRVTNWKGCGRNRPWSNLRYRRSSYLRKDTKNAGQNRCTEALPFITAIFWFPPDLLRLVSHSVFMETL
jgi:hypothetical protein